MCKLLNYWFYASSQIKSPEPWSIKCERNFVSFLQDFNPLKASTLNTPLHGIGAFLLQLRTMIHISDKSCLQRETRCWDQRRQLFRAFQRNVSFAISRSTTRWGSSPTFPPAMATRCRTRAPCAGKVISQGRHSTVTWMYTRKALYAVSAMPSLRRSLRWSGTFDLCTREPTSACSALCCLSMLKTTMHTFKCVGNKWDLRSVGFKSHGDILWFLERPFKKSFQLTALFCFKNPHFFLKIAFFPIYFSLCRL